MRYEAYVTLPYKEYDRINNLFEINNLEELSNAEREKLGAQQDTLEGVYTVQFGDGSYLNYDLCSDSHEYRDEVTWTSPDGSNDVTLTVMYKLNDFEFVCNGNLYCVKVLRE